MTWDPKGVDYRSIPGMDPAANWLLGANAEEFLIDGEETLIPFVMNYDGVDLKSVMEATRNIDGAVLVVPDAGEEEGERAAGAWPCLANRRWFEELANEDGALGELRAAATSFILSNPLPVGIDPNLNEADPGYAPPAGGWPADTVVMGVIDDGVAFANERFRRAMDESRVYGFWNMNVDAGGKLTNAQIDASIANNRVAGGGVEENGVYRDTGLVDFRDLRRKPAAWRRAHGTHVMDLCAGYGPSVNRTNRPIIAVQLPVSAVEDTQGRFLQYYLFRGIEHIVRRARQLKPAGPRLPVVINASFGYIAGPHDGSSLLERYADARIDFDAGKTQIVLPAGNSHLSRCHAVIDFNAANPVEFDWIVLPNDMTTSYFDVWPTDPNLGERLKLTVAIPGLGAHTIVEADGASTVVKDAANRVILLMQFHRYRATQRFLRVQIQPTDRFRPSQRAVAPAGAWKLTFEPGADGMEGPAHAWIQRDDTIPGYPQRGRQSYFHHPDYLRYDVRTFEVEEDSHPDQGPCPVRRSSLMNAISTGARVITAGGYRECECRIARYSAGGPNIPAEAGDLRKPDALLPSETSKALPGILGAGSRSGSVVALSGTSVAAPQLARLVANWLGAGVGDRPKVRAEADLSAACPAGFDANRGGRGRFRRDPQDRRPVERRFCP